jgi:DNA primase
VTVSWWKEERGANIFVDFNQNSRDRTIASAYSLRPIKGAPVSTPVRWEELDGLDPRTLNLHTVPGRLAEHGDAMAAIDDHPGSLETLLQMYADDIASGLTDMPYPPDYPKMPGEPPRVQPSRINPLNWANDGS